MIRSPVRTMPRRNTTTASRPTTATVTSSTTIDTAYSTGEPAPIAIRYGVTIGDVNGKMPSTSPSTESPAEIATT